MSANAPGTGPAGADSPAAEPHAAKTVSRRVIDGTILDQVIRNRGLQRAPRTIRTLFGLGLLVAAALAPASALGQDAIEPDRPSVANSTQTVSPGAVQFETGLSYERTSLSGTEAERRLSVSALARVGVTERLELRLEGEPFIRLRGSEEASDHGDVLLGAKYRLQDASGAWLPSLGLQPFVKIPVADEPLGSERPDYGLLALISIDLPERLSLDVNIGLAAIGQSAGGGFIFQRTTAASLGWRMTEQFSPFAEVFYASRAERADRGGAGFDAGLVYLVTNRVALDAAVETTLHGQGPDYAVRAGLSLRFGR